MAFDERLKLRVKRRAHFSCCICREPYVEVHHQLFVSGLANRHTYLINSNNGSTWQLTIAKDQTLVWSPITGESGGAE
jgi:5-methylcytosine-specific restriction endonuclease McrA